MARSTKTKHVMDLVGAERKKPRPKPVPSENVEKAPTVPKIIEITETKEPQELPVEETTEDKALPEETVQEEAHEAEQQPAAPTEEKVPVRKPMITAIVCELINQELGSVAERFRLKLTDSNLWVLTRAALEEVRPEFAADSEDREEKLERLRPQVIGAMAKVAIKIAAKDRNN